MCCRARADDDVFFPSLFLWWEGGEGMAGELFSLMALKTILPRSQEGSEGGSRSIFRSPISVYYFSL